jgi:cytoskeletal protein CcmA (bactofilin family)
VFGNETKRREITMPSEEAYIFLARGFEFKGILTFDGTVRIDGRVIGEIHTNGTLIMGEHAEIEGDVTAGTIVSSGRINGNVTASEKVQLVAPAAVAGTVRTPLLQVEEGVRLVGALEAEGTTPGEGQEEDRESALQAAKLRVMRTGAGR